MNQIELLKVAESLKPGQAIVITREDMLEAARGELRSLLFDTLRKSDIEAFIKKISENWGVRITERLMSYSYEMYKPEAQPVILRGLPPGPVGPIGPAPKRGLT